MIRRVVVNQSYAPQRVTGQQRYAIEIVRRIVESDDFMVARPTGRWAGSTLRVWCWVQFLLPFHARGATVLSLTSRAPFWRRRHVLVVHDLFVLTNPEWYSRRYIWTHAPLLRAQIWSAAAVVAVSRPVADQLGRLRRDEIDVAPNAPSEFFWHRGADPDDDALVARGLEPGQYLLAVGSRDPRKNLTLLARAYDALSEAERAMAPLVVVGGSAAIFRDEQLHWPTGTVDAGYVSDDELRQLYRHAKSVVFVSKAEGFGLPIVEAAAAGTRGLLVSEIEVFRWICGSQARYVDPHSVDAIATALRLEIDHPQHQEVNLARFDWDASAAVVAAVCRRVARDT